MKTVIGGVKPEVWASRWAIADRLPGLTWRRHGIGCLQAYLQEYGDVETRIHIWHPDIVREGIVDHGDIHNHRFDLESSVLVGEILQTEFEVVPGDDYTAYTVVHARAEIGARYVPMRSVWGPGAFPIGDPWRVGLRTAVNYRVHAGQSYTFPRGAFHRSSVNGLGVTLVRKSNQVDEKAMILARSDSPPVHAFEDPDDFNMAPFVEMAFAGLTA